jgi:hypothetical protein
VKQVKPKLYVRDRELPEWARGLSGKLKNALINESERFTPPVSPDQLTIGMVVRHDERQWLYMGGIGPKSVNELMAYIRRVTAIWPERTRP